MQDKPSAVVEDPPQAPAEGYLQDQPWSFNYQQRLSPGHISFLLGIAGIDLPAISRFCELAYGQGVSLVINAAANPLVEFSGTDFNPIHAEVAKELAGDSLPNASLHLASFADYFSHHAAASFDVIAMLGTWPWIPVAEQDRILAFTSKALSPQGLFCHDNMVLPGNVTATALRHLLVSLATRDPPAESADPTRTLPAVRRAIELLETNPACLHEFSNFRANLEWMAKARPEELAHEYFNYSWTSNYFLDTVRQMQNKGLSWACPWSLNNHIDSIHFTARQRAYLNGIADIHLQQQIKDYMLCQTVREDIWSRSQRVVDPAIRRRTLRSARFMLQHPLSGFDWKIRGALGELHLGRETAEQLSGRSERQRDFTFDDFLSITPTASEEDAFLLIIALVDGGYLSPTRMPDSSINLAVPRCDALNRRIIKMSTEGRHIGALASPVTGAGIKVPELHMTFLGARQAGARDVEAYAMQAARQAKERADAASDPARKTADATPQKYLAQARAFETAYLPIYKSLLVVL